MNKHKTYELPLDWIRSSTDMNQISNQFVNQKPNGAAVSIDVLPPSSGEVGMSIPLREKSLPRLFEAD